jgi:hypothetical protein
MEGSPRRLPDEASKSDSNGVGSFHHVLDHGETITIYNLRYYDNLLILS